IFGLIQELAHFVGEPDRVLNSPAQMRRERDSFHAFVATAESGEIIGHAVYYYAYSTWVGKSLYLDDLYVQPACRRQQIGKRLLKALFEKAQVEGCHRVRWQVLKWNENAIAFYTKCGGHLDDGFYNCD